MVTENPPYGISDLAREFGITPRAIRFYEDQGMITPLRTGNSGRTRLFSQRDRTRLKLLLRGKRLGLSLLEIKGLLELFETPADTIAQLDRFLAVLDERRQSLRLQLNDLTQMLADIDRQRSDAQRALEDLQDRQAKRESRAVASDNAAS